MINKENEKWIEAARIICCNSSEKILCPRCGKAFLIVEDVRAGLSKFERIMRCKNCGAYNAILMIKYDDS
jgi:uncharacterized Zn finger protein